MFAVVRTGGKQYKVAAGDQLDIETLVGAQPGQAIELGQVLMVGEDDSVQIGQPFLENAAVRATVVSHGRGDKIKIFKFKAKKRYRKRAGHRQHFTRVRIDEIVA